MWLFWPSLFAVSQTVLTGHKLHQIECAVRIAVHTSAKQRPARLLQAAMQAPPLLQGVHCISSAASAARLCGCAPRQVH